jgi:hypothetical protein
MIEMPDDRGLSMLLMESVSGWKTMGVAAGVYPCRLRRCHSNIKGYGALVGDEPRSFRL